MTRPWKVAAVAAAAALLATACGSDDDGNDSPSVTTPATAESTGDTPTTIGDDNARYPVTVEAANGPVTLEAIPDRIVSLSPTATEMLFAIGAGGQVVAVDDQSTYPAEAAAKATSLSGFTPSAEAISGYEPDLVVMEEPREAIDEQLSTLGIPYWSGPGATTFEDIYDQIEQLGALTGHLGEAAELVARMQADIEAATANLPDREVPLTFYHELDNTYFTVASGSFIGAVYDAAGLRNIADATEADTLYPQLSAEFIVSQNPDLIFLADAEFGETAETVAARPAWGQLTAVTNGAIFPLDADVASRWGPRVVDFLRTVTDAVATLDAITAAG